MHANYAQKPFPLYDIAKTFDKSMIILYRAQPTNPINFNKRTNEDNKGQNAKV